ncbi:hypothetical protein JANAI62_36650 [Jannaschia pagri]|uniref:Membrane-bound lysozyme-inhibitor of c-type lysozyme n=1 Tax=Jannaschia pagri TaxID=2829797 RepID=A0ABQ4NRK3_9RHOB|nr:MULTISPECIES: hypothetical protein [unclassified Jannaschia]GIT93191.1 hypothetical protein JANAI61_36490 [Jannaschia sp. AI_61]GIT97042.1 hypothetical protein JANAI62_36650 [Jannaschia sp. AI_62]
MRHLLVIAALALPLPAAAQEWRIELIETGLREYYCTGLVRLTNDSDQVLEELSGFFLIQKDGVQVGRSQGTWFLNVAPGETAEATFETPNAPCAEADRWDYIVGACRLDGAFADKQACAARIEGVAPLSAAVGAN